MRIDSKPIDATVEAEIRRLQYPPDERERRFQRTGTLDLDAWERIATPATLDELAKTEEFLRERDLEREISLARDAGLDP